MLITTGTKLAERPTDARGSVTIGGLSAFIPGRGRDRRDQPRRSDAGAQESAPGRRSAAGVPAEVQIGLVGGGDIEGAIVKNGGLGFEGLDLELVDGSGKVVATARTDFDGFFLFERVPYGNYPVRVAQNSAAAAQDRGRFRHPAPLSRRTNRSSGWARSTSYRRRTSRRRSPRRGALSSSPQCPTCPRHVGSCDGAVEKTRTSTALRPQRPQRCASTSSATTARHEMSRRMGRRHWHGGASSKAPRSAQCVPSVPGQSLRACLPFGAAALRRAMLLLAAAAIAASAQSAGAGPVAPRVQARATIRILSGATVVFGGPGRMPKEPSARRSPRRRLGTTGKLMEFQ